MSFRFVQATVLLTVALFFAGSASAGEKKLMHCFFFTPIAEATDADWTAFYKATDEMVAKIDGLNRVWAGKLRSAQANREYGVCMELDDEKALEAYASHEAHDEWMKFYEKVRVAGTTTFDLLGQ